MTNALPTAAVPSGASLRARRAWSEFWNDPAQTRCASGAAGVWQVLERHWSAVARSLAPGARVLDLGCGAGAVGRMLLAARDDISVTGVDFARLPLTLLPRIESLSETAMEALPFADRSFSAAVSQFGFEYGDTAATTRELARTLLPGAAATFVVHHADSAIVRTTRARLDALEKLLAPEFGAAFRAADIAAFDARMRALILAHREDALIEDLARSLPSRLQRAPRERAAIWKAIEDALAPERCISECLAAACVPETRIAEWLGPLARLGELRAVELLREADGTPIAWRVEAVF
jgi:SAM-dependent methyltransferase